MTRALRYSRIYQKCSIGAERNFGPVRKRDRRSDVDLHFARRKTHPEQRSLERKRRYDFAAVLEQQRHVKIIDAFVRSIDKPER